MSNSERVLRVGYVREHFSSPLLQLADEDGGKTLKLVECPSGTGQIISRLLGDEIDVAIALTDPLLAGIANGRGTPENGYKLVGSYVTSPLNWAVVTGKDSKYQSIADLRGSTLGISRAGSGSQTMASVMALQHGWTDTNTGLVENLKFQINNDINGLNTSVNDGTTSAYLWEWFTTKPWADRGEVRFIGSVPTPWPSWMIAAHTSSDRAPPEAVRTFLERLTTFVRAFDSKANRDSADVKYIEEKFGYPEADIKAWLETASYTNDTATIREAVVRDTLDVLRRAGVVSPGTSLKMETYVDPKVAKILALRNDSSVSSIAHV